MDSYLDNSFTVIVIYSTLAAVYTRAEVVEQMQGESLLSNWLKLKVLHIRAKFINYRNGLIYFSPVVADFAKCNRSLHGSA